jgi:hypothetical protein
MIEPDAVQWMLMCEIVKAHPEALTVEALGRLHPGVDVEEPIARLQIDGLAVRFGDWVKASEPAARFDQLARFADSHGGRTLVHRAA